MTSRMGVSAGLPLATPRRRDVAIGDHADQAIVLGHGQARQHRGRASARRLPASSGRGRRGARRGSWRLRLSSVSSLTVAAPLQNDESPTDSFRGNRGRIGPARRVASRSNRELVLATVSPLWWRHDPRRPRHRRRPRRHGQHRRRCRRLSAGAVQGRPVQVSGDPADAGRRRLPPGRLFQAARPLRARHDRRRSRRSPNMSARSARPTYEYEGGRQAPCATWAPARCNGGAKAIVIYIHGMGGSRVQGVNEGMFGGNFNRIMNLMKRNDGAYLSPDFSDFGPQGAGDIGNLIRDQAQRSPNAAIFIACGSWGGAICWQLAADPKAVKHIAGLLLLGSNHDDRFIKSAGGRRQGPPLPGLSRPRHRRSDLRLEGRGRLLQQGARRQPRLSDQGRDLQQRRPRHADPHDRLAADPELDAAGGRTLSVAAAEETRPINRLDGLAGPSAILSFDLDKLDVLLRG